VSDKLTRLINTGKTYEEAWNEVAVDLTRASRAHTQAFLARNFLERIQQLREDLGIKVIMKNMLDIYLYYELLQCSSGLLEDGYISRQQLENIRTNLYERLQEFRSNAVNVVDAFGFYDRELNSVIGRKDGNVYENLFKWAKNEQPINQMDVLPFHERYLGRGMKEARRMNSKL